MQILFLLLLFTTMLHSLGNTTHSAVIQLTDESFDKALSEIDFLIVKFYAPWCNFCKALAPEYTNAAESLSTQTNIKFSQVDIIEEKELSKKHKIASYPAIRMYSKYRENYIEYQGDRTAEDILKWIERRIMPPSVEINNVSAAQDFIKINELTGFFFGSTESNKYKEFLKIAEKHDGLVFANIANHEVMKSFEMESGGFVLYRKFGGTSDVLKEPYYEGELEKFILRNNNPDVTLLNRRIVDLIFGKEINTIVLFQSSKTTDRSLEEIYQNLSLKYRIDLLFVTTDIEDEYGQDLARQFGLKKHEIPAIAILQVMYSKKYLYEGELSFQNLSQFIEYYLAGKLEPYFKSAPIPEKSYEDGVRILVGKNFKEVVYDDSKDVLVEFYAPWCAYCQAFESKYSALAQGLASINDLVIAKMDKTTNEVNGVEVNRYPTLRLYRKGKKDEPVEYNGGLKNTDMLIEFLKNYATVNFKNIEGKKSIQIGEL